MRIFGLYNQTAFGQKPFIYLFAFITFALTRVDAQKNKLNQQDVSVYTQQLTAAPLLFSENKGQVVDFKGNAMPEILFTANGAGMKMFLTATGINYQFQHTNLLKSQREQTNKMIGSQQTELHDQRTTETCRFTLSLKGANPNPVIRKEVENEYTENYYLSDRAITSVHTYERLVYENVYPGIDWIIYSTNTLGSPHLEYDFLVHPKADPSLIKLQIRDALKVSIAKNGELMVNTKLGVVKEAAPISYSETETIRTTFIQNVDGSIGFKLSKWNRNKNLRIDPAIVWATYYGGTNYDSGAFAVTDALGNVYLAGTTGNASGIASGGYQNYLNGTYNVFLVKFNSAGVRIWATYYGSTSGESPGGCAIDATGNVYITGRSSSTTGLASASAFQTSNNGGFDVFLVKFDSNGARLWATYYGTPQEDAGQGCATDLQGNVFITGYSASTSGIAFNGFQNTSGGGYDAFLAKFSSTGSLLWATYCGGSSTENGMNCATDVYGNAYITGITSSTNGIASAGFQNTYQGSDDAFLVKYNANGNRLWGTYYGGANSEWGYGCTTDASANVYLCGSTSSSNAIAFNASQSVLGGGNDAFFVKFDANGNRLWATYYGGTGSDYSYSCATDASGNGYLFGYSNSATAIANNGFQNTLGGGVDGFVAKFDANGNRLWGSYYGGSGDEQGNGGTVDPSGFIYFAGNTTSSNGIASKGFQNSLGGGSDAFLAKIDGSNLILPITLLSFVAQKMDNTSAKLIWQTSVETNDNEQFEIQRSVDGHNFNTIGKIMTQGATTIGHAYSFIDAQPLQGDDYYRLKIIGSDGNVTYSNVQLISFVDKNKITFFPNPVKDNVTVKGLENSMQLTLINSKGQIIARQLANGNSTKFMLGGFAAGMYLIQVYNTNGNIIKTLQLTKY